MLENAVGAGSETVVLVAADLLSALRARDVRVWVDGFMVSRIRCV